MPRILVVDDERQILRNVIEILRFEGYEAEGAEDGRSGITRAKTWLPDLVLCDVMMPQADGFIVLQELRGDPDTAQIPVIMMSAKVDRDTRRMVIEQGARDYLAKPFTMPDLVQTIRRHV